MFRYSVKCIQEVTKNDSFSFKNLFLMLYPTQDRYYSGVCTKLKLKQYSLSLLTLVVEKRLTAHKRSTCFFFTQHVKISSY